MVLCRKINHNGKAPGFFIILCVLLSSAYKNAERKGLSFIAMKSIVLEGQTSNLFVRTELASTMTIPELCSYKS